MGPAGHGPHLAATLLIVALAGCANPGGDLMFFPLDAPRAASLVPRAGDLPADFALVSSNSDESPWNGVHDAHTTFYHAPGNGSGREFRTAVWVFRTPADAEAAFREATMHPSENATRVDLGNDALHMRQDMYHYVAERAVVRSGLVLLVIVYLAKDTHEPGVDVLEVARTLVGRLDAKSSHGAATA